MWPSLSWLAPSAVQYRVFTTGQSCRLNIDLHTLTTNLFSTFSCLSERLAAPSHTSTLVMEVVEVVVEVGLTGAGLTEVWPWGGEGKGGGSGPSVYSRPGQPWSWWSHDRQITVVLPPTNTPGNIRLEITLSALQIRPGRFSVGETEVVMVPTVSAQLVV